MILFEAEKKQTLYTFDIKNISEAGTMSQLGNQLKSSIINLYDNYIRVIKKEEKLKELKKIIDELIKSGIIKDEENCVDVEHAWETRNAEYSISLSKYCINDSDIITALNEITRYITADAWYLTITSKKLKSNLNIIENLLIFEDVSEFVSKIRKIANNAIFQYDRESNYLYAYIPIAEKIYIEFLKDLKEKDP